MAAPVALPTLLSQLLVAFTIEFDNEFENRMPHWTTNAGRAAGPRGAPWLVSQVMWSNVMQYLDDDDDDDIRVGELHARSRTTSDSLAGLERWGYVVVTPPAASRGGQGDNVLVRPTVAGRLAQALWSPLAAEVEARWILRFGAEAIDDLRRALEVVREHFRGELPRYLPIVHPAQNGKAAASLLSGAAAAPEASEPDVSVQLAQVLLRFALDYEAEARVSLPIAANTLRVLDETGVAIRELPRLTGVSKEANSMALGFLARRACLVLEPDPTARRGQRARLTPKGKKSQDKYLRLLAETEQHWKDRFGAGNIARLRRALVHIAGDRIPLMESLLSQGLKSYSGGWRASTKPAETLPHYPMVLHRGGFPDGS